MPPKPRGGASTRARGGGRGGAAAGRSSNDEADPQSSEQATATAAPVAVPKQDNEEEIQQPPSADASATASPNDDTTRPPVQRLASLNTSRSASPAVRRGASSRGKRGPIKPTFTGRRSKEERAALEKEALEREKARTKELEDADRKKKRDADFRARRDAERASRGRGGYSGSMSGPFSLGSSQADRKNNNRSSLGFGSGSGSRATRIKDETDGGHGSHGGSGYRSSGGPSIKREDGVVESSDDEEDAEFPRMNIDEIIVISDDDEAAPVRAPRPTIANLPVRIGRKEHQERTFGINTDASTEASAKLLEQAEATGQSPAAVLTQISSKGKGKAKEVNITSVKKPFKGVWQDPEELESPVKTEENSEDENMVEAEQVGIIERPAPPAEQLEQREPSPDTERKAKGRIKGIAEPILQTDEDRAEWARIQTNLSHIRAELGPPEPRIDENGDVSMAEVKGSVRDNNVYLFQIPPLMPELLATTIKKEPPSTDAAPPPPTAPPTSSTTSPAIKTEETFSDPSHTSASAPRFASGLVGKIRVRASGRTTLDWGGTSYELNPGKKASFLQEVVSVRVVPEKERVVPEDAGEAVSFGQVKGKFVVVPEWGVMLG